MQRAASVQTGGWKWANAVLKTALAQIHADQRNVIYFGYHNFQIVDTNKGYRLGSFFDVICDTIVI